MKYTTSQRLEIFVLFSLKLVGVLGNFFQHFHTQIQMFTLHDNRGKKNSFIVKETLLTVSYECNSL